MNTTRARNGKIYPATRDRDELARIIGLEHTFACQLGLSHRKVQRRLLYAHGIRRSLGSISQDLSRFECDACEVKPERVPVAPEVIAWH